MIQSEKDSGGQSEGLPCGRVQRLLSWYRAPNQEILRRELSWTKGWLKSPVGLLCLSAQLLIPLMNWMFFRLYQSVGASAASNVGALYWIISVVQLLLTYGPWVYLFHRRSMAPFQRGRLPDLLISNMTSKNLWPGLFAAPVTFLVCIVIVRHILSILFGSAFVPNGLIFSFPIYLSAWFSSSIFIAAQIVEFLFFGLAACTFITCFALTKPGTVRVILLLLAAWALTTILLALFQGPFFLFFSIVFDSDDFARWARPLFIASVFIRVAIEIWFYRNFIRRLHAENFWEKLRAHGERS